MTKSTTILSRLVHIVTSDTYTQVSISFEENLQPLYSSSRKNGCTMFPAGPCTEELQYGYYGKHAEIPCKLYELNVSDEIYVMAREEVLQIINHAGDYHFNIIGLLLCQLNIPYHRKHHFFCSQFVSEILTKSRALKLPKDTSLMKPADYTRIPELVCRYQGSLCDLVQTHLALAAV